ncbi:MAG: HAD family hydrolase [Candidatus Pacebacteria bacterium]|nr:HAD family hydrolase [Candidatus Paceibacterota bacterium]
MKNLKNSLVNKQDIVFDLDQTITTLLIDWSDFKLGLIPMLIKHFPDVNQVIDKNSREIDIANQVIEAYGKVAKDLINQFAQQYEKEYYHGHRVNYELLKFINSNQDKYNLYLWTNNQRPLTNIVLEELGILGLFKKTVSSTDTLFYKPHIEGFNLIWADSTKDKRNFLMIGDSKYDRIAAQNAQINFINVRDI